MDIIPSSKPDSQTVRQTIRHFSRN